MKQREAEKKTVAEKPENKKPVEAAPPHVYRVEKMLDKTLTTRRKIKELEALRTEKKGPLGGDDSVDLALKALHDDEAKIANGFRAIEEAFPSEKGRTSNAWLFLGLAIAALGLPRLFDYFSKKKSDSVTDGGGAVGGGVGNPTAAVPGSSVAPGSPATPPTVAEIGSFVPPTSAALAFARLNEASADDHRDEGA